MNLVNLTVCGMLDDGKFQVDKVPWCMGMEC